VHVVVLAQVISATDLHFVGERLMLKFLADGGWEWGSGKGEVEIVVVEEEEEVEGVGLGSLGMFCCMLDIAEKDGSLCV
jgi:hypothetical protein